MVGRRRKFEEVEWQQHQLYRSLFGRKSKPNYSDSFSVGLGVKQVRLGAFV
jgi:hypothetical protein